MGSQMIFKRYELKYMLSPEQYDRVRSAMEPYMQPDEYGRVTIRNLYFDTDTYLLVRRSTDKPVYKEKLRVRSYAAADGDSSVFVELKKKYNGVVYKRRVKMKEREAADWLCNGKEPPFRSQIVDEIDYFKENYDNLMPRVYLSYEREAFFSKDGSSFRVTFDSNVLCREDGLTLCSEPYGAGILESGKILMELKCSGGIPMWMADVLSREKIYKTSFSKYGTAYRTLIYPKLKEEKVNV